MSKKDRIPTPPHHPAGEKGIDPKAIGPEITDPKTTTPEIIDPKTTDPEITDPETASPEIPDPKKTDPEIIDPKPRKGDSNTDKHNGSAGAFEATEGVNDEEDDAE